MPMEAFFERPECVGVEVGGGVDVGVAMLVDEAVARSEIVDVRFAGRVCCATGIVTLVVNKTPKMVSVVWLVVIVRDVLEDISGSCPPR